MTLMPNIDLARDRIEDFCRRHGIARLALFGSVLRDDFGPESDIDILVELAPGHRVGLFALAAMEQELSEMLGRKVDLRTPHDLSRYFREDVVRTAEVLYAA
jgi:uncharacterized protein